MPPVTEAQRQALDAGRMKAHEMRRRRRELIALEIRMLAEFCTLIPRGRRGLARRLVELMEARYGERVVSEWTVRRVLKEAA